MYTRDFWDLVYARHFNDAPWLMGDWTKVGVEFACKYIDKTFTGRILDYGCGNAAVSQVFMEQGCHVDLAEISSKMLDYLKKEYARYIKDGYCNVLEEVSTPSAITPPKKDERYDYILALGLFHHIDPEYWSEFMAAFHRLLVPDGILLIDGWDADDVVLPQYNMRGPMTGEVSWPITNLRSYINPNKFEVIEDQPVIVRIRPFTNLRTVRRYALRKISKLY